MSRQDSISNDNVKDKIAANISDNIKDKLQILDELPVSLAQVVPEVRLDSIDRLPRDLAHEFVRDEEVTSK